MTLRLIRRIAIVLVAFYALGQAGVALAACGMDRGAMAIAMQGEQPCGDCAQTGGDSFAAVCVTHCTSDLQLTSAAPDTAVAPAIESHAVVPSPRSSSPPVLAYLPPGTLPRRILLHSFQI